MARYKSVSFSINGKGYICCGESASGYMNDLWEYDDVSDAWTQKADYGGAPVISAAAMAINNSGYVIGGRNANGYTRAVWMYDAAGNQWQQSIDIPATGRINASTFVIANIGYLIAGRDSSGLLNQVWQFDPSLPAWTAKNNFSFTPRENGFAFQSATNGFYGTGYDNTFHYKKDFYSYDPLTDQWLQKADFATIRWGAVGFSIGNYGYAGTGFYSNNIYNDFYSYDFLNNTWTTLDTIPGSGRSHAGAFVIGNNAYLCNGSDNVNFLNDVFEFQPTVSSIDEYTSTTSITVVNDVLILKNAPSGNVFILNSAGSEVLQQKINADGKINIEYLTPGIYYVLLAGKNSRLVERFVRY